MGHPDEEPAGNGRVDHAARTARLAGRDRRERRRRQDRRPAQGGVRGDPIFQGGADFDLELVETRTLDGHIQELVYRPTLH